MDFDLNGQFGRSYNTGLASARFELPGTIPMYLKFIGVVSKKKYYESEKLFQIEESPTFITQSENYDTDIYMTNITNHIRLSIHKFRQIEVLIDWQWGHYVLKKIL